MNKILSWFLFVAIVVALSGCTAISKNKAVQNKTSKSQEIDENKISEQDESGETLKDQPVTEETKSVDTSNEEELDNKTKKESTINKKIVVIDPGHSSNGNNGMEKQSPGSEIMKIKDPGGAQGISTRTPEYVVAMNVSLKLKSLLEQHNITVIMTKTQDSESPGNIERAEVGNNNNADLAIRIHCDSSESQSVRGASMLTPAPIGYAKDISAVSKEYGQVILNDLVFTVGMNNRGVVERSDLTGFNWSKVPVVLIEMGFMSNREEDRLLNDDSYQNKLAEGLCKGIIDVL